jgi:hypothetical protein
MPTLLHHALLYCCCVRVLPPVCLLQVQQELRRLGKEERVRQERAVQEVLKGAQVGRPGCRGDWPLGNGQRTSP